MDLVSFRSVVWLLALLSIFVTVITNYWRHGNIDLTGRWANVRAVYARSVAVGIVLAAILRANIIDILQNPQSPATSFGWLNLPWGQYATLGEKIVGYEQMGQEIILDGTIYQKANNYNIKTRKLRTNKKTSSLIDFVKE